DAEHLVAIDDEHLVVELGEHPGGEHAGHASAEHHGPVSEAAVHRPTSAFTFGARDRSATARTNSSGTASRNISASTSGLIHTARISSYPQLHVHVLSIATCQSAG